MEALGKDLRDEPSPGPPTRAASACVGVEAPDRGGTTSGTAGRRELFARHEVQRNEHLRKWPWGATAANVVFAANVYPQDELRGITKSGWGAWASRIDVRRQAAYVLQVLR